MAVKKKVKKKVKKSVKKSNRIKKEKKLYIFVDYAPDITVFRFAGDKWRYHVSFYQTGMPSMSVESKVLYDDYEDAIIDAFEIFDILGFEIIEAIEIEILEFNDKKSQPVRTLVKFDGEHFTR